MAFTAKCPKCKREAGIAFSVDLSKKLIVCSCGHNGPVSDDLNFERNPEYLFKYRPHDCYSEAWILNEELFFASPATFNDPFDSKVMYNIEGTFEQKKRYLNYIINEERPEIRKKKKWKLI